VSAEYNHENSDVTQFFQKSPESGLSFTSLGPLYCPLMLHRVISFLRAKGWILLGFLIVMAPLRSKAQATVNVRIMAANLNGNSQTYEPFALRIFEGLKPDVVCIQEFNYSNNAASDFRSMVDTAFGTNFVYYREPYNANGDLPNGIISRYPIVASGSWVDNSVANRGFAWAQIHLPGTNDLYAVSVHLLTSSSGARATEALELKDLIQTNFPPNAWVVLAGDFNTDSRTESAMTTFKTFLSDNPIPADNNGNSNTSGGRNHPHDYVLPSFSFTNVETASVFPSHSFPNGLVFDSQVYTPLSDVAPVQFLDTTNAQHMAVIKDFSVTDSGSGTNAPSISTQPPDQTVPAGSNVLFSVIASGAAPLNYQWYFNTNILITNATTSTLTVTNAQLTNAGSYSVVITNTIGSITSSIAVLTVTNAVPSITTQPQSKIVRVGGNATFSVAATGTEPLGYQWYFNTNNLVTGAVSNFFTVTNTQLTNAGAYSVIVSNSEASVTSLVATLTVTVGVSATNIVAQWNFNSVTADNNTSTGTTTPSIGSGTASLLGGVTPAFFGGDSSLDPAGSTDNSGWSSTGYPAQGAGNKTRGVQFNVSTSNKQHIAVSWSSQSSNTGSKYGRLQYSTNGSDFVDFPFAFTNGTSFTSKTNSLLGVTGVENNPNFAIRLVSEFESSALNDANANYVPANSGSTYGSAGTMRYDMVTILGDDIPAIILLPSPAVLSSPSIVSSNQFQFTVAGSYSSNYVIQVSTNLNETNWTSIFTNASPFTFIDSNVNIFPQGFYRAIALP
jgi:endonuclease/exonuclease/phosphatase family metal-dependent hydrolase